jgi:hypothetical protein
MQQTEYESRFVFKSFGVRKISETVQVVSAFWPLKCVNWNFGASHFPEVCWKGREERGGKGAILKLSPSSSFLHSVVRILGSPTKISGQKRRGDYYSN